MSYVLFTGNGKQRPEDFGTCNFGLEIETSQAIGIKEAKEILITGERLIKEKFNFVPEFFRFKAEMSKSKSITYNGDKNLLRVWVDNMPVYENYNGNICRDESALADSIL